MTTTAVGTMMLFAMAVQARAIVILDDPARDHNYDRQYYPHGRRRRALACWLRRHNDASREGNAWYRARRIGLALASFTIGAITGGLARRRVGYVALLGSRSCWRSSIGHSELRATAQF